jgi:flagellar hook-associated protein 3 FlgL
MATIIGFGNRSTIQSQTLVQMRAQLDDLQRQLATGKKSETYAGLGLARGLDLEVRARLSRIENFQTSIFNVDLRVNMMNTALERIRTVGADMRSETRFPLSYELVSGGQTAAQRTTTLRLDEVLSLLNEKAGDRYLFSGRATDQPATETVAHILNGDGARAGFKQVMAERLLADQGADQRGRLLAPAAAGGVVTLSHDGVANHPFGFKLASVTTDFGATITNNAGPPVEYEIDLTGGNPVASNRVSIQLNQPDGTSVQIELTATTEDPPPSGSFLIGATPADTANNLASAIDAKILTLAKTELAAASAVKAGEDFFAIDSANPPQRVNGPPFETATAMIDGTATNTVFWYTGDAGTDDPRATAIARVDDTITVDYGVRGNEYGLRQLVQNMAVFSSMSFSESDPDARARYFAVASKVGAGLDGSTGLSKIEGIQTEIAGAKLAADAAKQRLDDKKPVLQGLVDDIENVSPEEVGTMLLTMSTRLQATLQTTALLSRFSLLNFM